MTIHTVSCGCCTNGCSCHMHAADKPKVCDHHKTTPHPRITSIRSTNLKGK